MPPGSRHPAVYVEEQPGPARTITGVPTSIAAFVGRAWKGPVDVPVTINSYGDYERAFGGLWQQSTMSYAVQQFFANGGRQAIIVRVATRTGGTAAKTATFSLEGGTTLRAAGPGSWAMNLSVTVDPGRGDQTDAKLLNMTVLDDPSAKNDSAGRGGSGARETFVDLSVDPASPHFVTTVLERQSNLVRVDSGPGPTPPVATTTSADVDSGTDGAAIAADDVVGTANDAASAGMYALRKADIFNLLVIPPYQPSTVDNDIATTWSDAADFCKERRAILLIDAPSHWTLDSSNANYPPSRIGDYAALERSYAALYFPRIRAADPLQDGNVADFAPCGAVAGAIARMDVARGVWKAPAGIEAGLPGVLGLSVAGLPATVTERENGDLNPLGINCLRTLPAVGTVVWGARTLEGSDALASEWKYLPVRRLALYIEESLYRGTEWVVFEPNDEPSWAQIRLTVGGFMQDLFRQGAFQGTRARDAYLVRCDSETTTQDDIDRGVVNILVGFAPLKPAEFVVIRIQQLAGQAEGPTDGVLPTVSRSPRP